MHAQTDSDLPSRRHASLRPTSIPGQPCSSTCLRRPTLGGAHGTQFALHPSGRSALSPPHRSPLVTPPPPQPATRRGRRDRHAKTTPGRPIEATGKWYWARLKHTAGDNAHSWRQACEQCERVSVSAVLTGTAVWIYDASTHSAWMNRTTTFVKICRCAAGMLSLD